MRLSPSRILCYEECPRQYHYKYLARLEREVRSANLVFGTTVHASCESILRAQAKGESFDAAGWFRRAWAGITAREEIEYTSRMGPDDLAATGEALCARFLGAWRAGGLTPLIDADGEPAVERSLSVEIAEEIVLSGRIDVVAMNAVGDAGPLDLKTPATESLEGFERVSDQLTAYDILVDGNREALGLARVGLNGFMEGIKRKVPARRTLDADETRRLLEVCDADLGDLVRAALATGLPVKALVVLEVREAPSRVGAVSAELAGILSRRGAGLGADDRLFRVGGKPWTTGTPARRLKAACGKAGIDPPVTFADFRTPEGGPEFRAPVLTGGRSEAERSEFRRKVIWIARDIADGRFPRRSRMAHNTPCAMCDFRGLCHDGSMEGLVEREPYQRKKQAASI
ncbi:MAG: PD-(D/E)XK nuclease family protein [Pseudomonadota bacterium]|nr:PD-(D/E)XK nuclease family protein [Pseudomonadota bacterium]